MMACGGQPRPLDHSNWQSQFEKCYKLTSPDKFKFPESRSVKQHPLPEFIAMREELNGVKSLLNLLPLEKWHKHTRGQNPAGFVIGEVRNKAKPELLTQAWCKFTEILFKYGDLVPEDTSKFTSVHLCEAPGAFITALNHFLKVNRSPGCKWTWTGATLNPYHEGNTTSSMINDDRFILHTLDNWHFGLDDTGNLMDKDNLRYLIKSFDHSVDLVTADGSIDCQADPARQEVLVAGLHFAEILAALGCLRIGGNFVIKMFTFYEADTLNHLFLLRSSFKSLDVFKPATSKEGNSEVYVVCRGFLGVDEDNLNSLIDSLGDDDDLGISKFDLKPDFVTDVKECARFFMDIQVSVIQRNLRTFDQFYDKAAKIEEKKLVAKQFIVAHKIQALERPSDHIMKEARVKANSYVDDCRHLDERVENGTFMDRLVAKTRDERLASLQDVLANLYPSWIQRVKWVEWASTSGLATLPNLHFIHGANVGLVQSSKFCPSRAISLHKECLELLQDSPWPLLEQQQQKKRKLNLISYYPIKSLVVQTPILSKVTKLYPEILDIETLVIKPKNPAAGILECQKETIVVDLIDQILDTIAHLERGQHIIILDFVLLTRIQVGIFFILLHQFEEVGFMKPMGQTHGLFLSEFKGQFQHKAGLEAIKEALESSSADNAGDKKKKSLLSVLPMEYITQEPFYSLIVAHNINIIRECSLHRLKQS
jgi:cap2 methyltransferase